MRTLAGPVAVLACAPACAQLGGWSWTTHGCATQTPTTLALSTCGATCSDDAWAAASVPDSGWVSLDLLWQTDASCCVALFGQLTGPGGGSTFFVKQDASPFGLCSPSPPPCASGTSVSFLAKKGQTLRLQVDAKATDGCQPWVPWPTTLTASGFAFAPIVEPVILSATPAPAWSDTAVRIRGDNFGPTSQVLLDGAPATVLASSDDQLVVAPGLAAPGWQDVTVTTAQGSASAANLLQRWPTLEAVILDLATHKTLQAGIELGQAGDWWLGASGAALASPLSLGPGIHYGVLLDPAAGLFPLFHGVVNGAGQGNTSLQVPLDPALVGAAIPLQSLTIASATAAASFSNLVAPLVP